MINDELEQEIGKARQALANSIAVEKQIEQQIQKNNESIFAWQKRVEMAREANLELMAKQAEERIVQINARNNELTIEHQSQKDFTANLKKDISKIEARRFTSGPSAAQVLAETEGSDSAMDRLEHKIQAQEIEAKLGSETHDLEVQFEKQKKDSALEDELQQLKAQAKKD